MLTVLVGNDIQNREERLRVLRTQFEKVGMDVREYTDINFDNNELRMLSASAPLFGGVLAFVISKVADSVERREELEKLIPIFCKSQHHFVVSELSLLTGFLKTATSKGAVVETFELKEKPKKAEVFNSFLLTDAFMDRKRSLAWPLYRKAIDLGVEPRELHGKIYWAVKSMLIAGNAKSPGEGGLNPFVFQKAKQGAGKFQKEELEWMVQELAVMFHEALVSGLDMETALEAFVLKSLAH